MGRVLFYDHSLGVLVLDLTHAHTRVHAHAHTYRKHAVLGISVVVCSQGNMS